MKVSFDTLLPGTVLYDCHRERMGNTTMSRLGVWEVYVREVDAASQRALVSWNGNPAQWRDARYFKSLRRNPPEWVPGSGFGTREYCYLCQADRDGGHRPNCTHPRAVSARKKAAK